MNDVMSSQASLNLNHLSHDDLIDRFQKDCDLRKFATSNNYAIVARRFCAWLEERNMAAQAVTKRDLKEYLYHLQKNKQFKFGTIRYDFIFK